MENVKLVKIGGNIPKKKINSFDDILSSSSKIRDIINKKKTLKTCRYLEKTDFKVEDPINIQKPVIQNRQPTPKNYNTTQPVVKEKVEKPKLVILRKPKNDLKHYGENLERSTLSKRKSQNRSKSKSKPITEFFKKEEKSRKTKKYNRNEIKYIINSFKKMYDEKDYTKLNIFISRLNRSQTIQILYACNVVEYKTDAPLPLLKNIVFNIVLGNIQIMR